MSLSNVDKKRFRQIGHELHPIVTVADKGLTDNVRQEIDRALNDHELIKIKLVTDREGKKELTELLCRDFHAECVQSIGHIVLLYRAARQQDPKLSNLVRFKQP